jgi:hypothetical protein
MPGEPSRGPGEGGVLTTATAASDRHTAPHPLVGRPPLCAWWGRCARAAQGLRQEARAGPRGCRHWAKVRRGPECQRGRAGGGGRRSRPIGGRPVVLGRMEGRAPGGRGRGGRLHVRVSVAGEVGVLRCRGGRGRGAVGLRAQAEARGPGGAGVHGRVLVQHIAHVHGDRRAPRACWALEPPLPAAPTTNNCSPELARPAAAPAPPRPFIARAARAPAEPGLHFKAGGSLRTANQSGKPVGGEGFKRRQIAAPSGRWTGQGLEGGGGTEGASWARVEPLLPVRLWSSSLQWPWGPPQDSTLQVEKQVPRARGTPGKCHPAHWGMWCTPA